jgi:hypothetical protein
MVVLSLLFADSELNEFIVNFTGGGEFEPNEVDEEFSLYFLQSIKSKSCKEMKEIQRKASLEERRPWWPLENGPS